MRLGVDVARYGTDETVVVARDQQAVLKVVPRNGLSTMETAGMVQHVAKELGVGPADVFVDDTGVGGGVTDRLRELGMPVTAVLLGGRADDPTRFADKRAECYWRLRESLSPEAEQPLTISGKFDKHLSQLSCHRYTFTSRGQIRIEAKADLRARLGASPDHADALALTFASENSPPEDARLWLI